MAYSHAERTLATIRLLEAGMRDLFNGQDQLDAEQTQWLGDVGATARCSERLLLTEENANDR